MATFRRLASRLPLLAICAAPLCFPRAAAAAGDSQRNRVSLDYVVTSWTESDGLPAGDVSNLALGKDRYLWLATNAGVWRFDGRRFVSAADLGLTLPARSVRSLSVAPDGELWVGYRAPGGIARIANGRATVYGTAEGLPQAAIRSFEHTAAGETLAVTTDGVFKLTGRTWTPMVTTTDFSASAVLDMFVDSHNIWYFSTNVGLFTRATGATRFELLDPTIDDVTVSMIEDASGNVWITDPVVGFRRLNGASTMPAIVRGRGADFLIDRRGAVWIATHGQGLWRATATATADQRIDTLGTDDGLAGDWVHDVIEDTAGNIWVATSEGLSRLAPRRVNPVPDAGLIAVVAPGPDASLWLRTVTDQVVQLTMPAKGDVRMWTGRLPDDKSKIQALHVDQKGVPWVATNNKLYRLTEHQFIELPLGRQKHPLRRIDRLSSDAMGNVWLYDLERGLFRQSDASLVPVQLPSTAGVPPAVYVMWGDRNGNMWLLFSRGDAAVVWSGGEVTMLGAQQGLEPATHYAVYQDGAGAIWIAGENGLSRFQDGRFTTIGSRQGLLTPIFSLTSDEHDHLWMGTPAGIVRVEERALTQATADRSSPVERVLLDHTDGVSGRPVFFDHGGAARADDGRLWFVTSRGLAWVDPKLEFPNRSPEIALESVTAEGARYGVQLPVVLPPRANPLRFDYTVLDLSSSSKYRFRYRLNGVDSDWVMAGTSAEASYAHLGAGEYQFEVQATGDRGLWSRSASLAFSIQPVFYETGWFLTACLAFTGIAGVAAWRLRVSQVRSRFAILLGERLRMSREIHDTLLQSLGAAAVQFYSLESTIGTAPQTAMTRVAGVRRMLEEAIRDAREAINNMRAPVLESRGFIDAMRFVGARLVEDGSIRFSFSVEGTPYQFRADVEEQLLRICQEAVANAIQHAHPTRITVVIAFQPSEVCLRVSDNGDGFDQQAKGAPTHYGLITMKERTSQIGGLLEVSSIVGSGTRVEVRVPVKRLPTKNAGLQRA